MVAVLPSHIGAGDGDWRPALPRCRGRPGIRSPLYRQRSEGDFIVENRYDFFRAIRLPDHKKLTSLTQISVTKTFCDVHCLVNIRYSVLFPKGRVLFCILIQLCSLVQ